MNRRRKSKQTMTRIILKNMNLTPSGPAASSSVPAKKSIQRKAGSPSTNKTAVSKGIARENIDAPRSTASGSASIAPSSICRIVVISTSSATAQRPPAASRVKRKVSAAGWRSQRMKITSAARKIASASLSGEFAIPVTGVRESLQPKDRYKISAAVKWLIIRRLSRRHPGMRYKISC